VLCWCKCHRGSVADPPYVDALNILEAAVACDHCKPRHCLVMLGELLANEAEPEPRVFDPTQWKDPQTGGRVADSGEGSE
jgi:hypothetical protein